MKIFKNWKSQDVSSFIIFLAKETQRQKKKMRNLYKRLNENAEAEIIHTYHVQQGIAVEADTIFTLAKAAFKVEDRKVNS
jgi:hypothetical protein